MDPIAAYISKFPIPTQDILNRIRSIIKNMAPEAEESISYGMPAYKIMKKPLVYFGGYQNHIGFYATPSGHTAFEVALSKYPQGKGSVKFPLNQPIPYDLIAEIVAYRVEENLAMTKKKN
tara:strand:- start:663 stop:1022 length:360 start_codon:yes stop_codon:yes gene_type:complete